MKKENIINTIDKYKKEFFDNIKTNYSYLIKPLIILLVIYSFAIFPIIRANINYIDDIGRVHSGYIEWDFFSRFVSKYCALFMHTGTYLADISPLPQCLAVFILAIAGVMLIHLFNDDKKISIVNIISVVPLSLSPYYLECLSFKYDAPYMALSVLASIFPFLFFKKNKKVFFGMNCLGALIMCMTYQASSGILPLVTIFLAFSLWNKKETKEAIKLVMLSGFSYLLGLCIFKLFILHPVDDYVTTSVYPLKELIPGFISNLKEYYSLLDFSLRKLWKILIAIVMICFIGTKTIESKQNKFLALLVSLIVIAISGIVMFGVLPALPKPLFASRAMYGVGAVIALMTVNITNNKKYILSKVVVFYLCWCFFIFSFIYGNALAEQKNYENFRIQTVIDELNDMEMMNNDKIKTINIRGTIGRAPSIENFPAGYGNMIGMLISQMFGESGYTYFANYFKLKNVNVVSDGSEQGIKFDYVKDTMYYQVWSNNEDYILLVLK